MRGGSKPDTRTDGNTNTATEERQLRGGSKPDTRTDGNSNTATEERQLRGGSKPDTRTDGNSNTATEERQLRGGSKPDTRTDGNTNTAESDISCTVNGGTVGGDRVSTVSSTPPPTSAASLPTPSTTDTVEPSRTATSYTCVKPPGSESPSTTTYSGTSDKPPRTSPSGEDTSTESGVSVGGEVTLPGVPETTFQFQSEWKQLRHNWPLLTTYFKVDNLRTFSIFLTKL